MRPAFYLNLSSVIFKSGSGTSAAPYTVEGTGDGTPTNPPATPAATPAPSVSPTPSAGAIISMEPESNSVINLWNDRMITLTAEFNSEIKNGSGKIYLKDYSTGTIISTITADGTYSYFSAEEKELYIYISSGDSTNPIPCGRKMYIEIEPDAIAMVDGTSFAGVKDKDAWTLTTAYGLTNYTERVNFLNSKEDFFNDYASEKYSFPIASSDLKSKLEGIIGKSELEMHMEKTEEFGGACFGISMVTALNKMNMINLTTFDSGAQTLYKMKKPKDSTLAYGVRDLINYYFLLQRVDDYKMTGLDTMWANAFRDKEQFKSTLEWIVEQGLNMNTSKKVLVLNFGWMDGLLSTCQHSVVLCSARKNDDGSYDLLIKDPNITYLTTMRVSSDYSSLTYGDANAVIVKTIDVTTVPSDWLIGNDNISVSSTDSVNSMSDDDYDTLKVIAYGNFTITNANGETLIIKDGYLSGTMDVLDEDFVDSGVNSYAEFVYKVNASDEYTFTSDDTRSSCAVTNNDSYIAVKADNASNIVMNKASGISVTGDNLTYTAFATTLSGDNLFAVSGQTEKNLNISLNDDGTSTITADSLTDVTFDSLYEDKTYVFDSDSNSATVVETEDDTLELYDVNIREVIEPEKQAYTIDKIDIDGNAVTVDVSANSDEYESATLIAAAYDAAGRVISVVSEDISGDSQTVTKFVNLNLDDADHISAFIWDDLSRMKPIAEKFTKEL